MQNGDQMGHEYSDASYKLVADKKPEKKASKEAPKSIPIILTREQDYTHLFFKKGEEVLEGTNFPLNLKAFKLEKNIKAKPPWRDILSAYGLDTRNFSYPKE